MPIIFHPQSSLNVIKFLLVSYYRDILLDKKSSRQGAWKFTLVCVIATHAQVLRVLKALFVPVYVH